MLISTEFLKSDIMLVRKFALGYKVASEWPLYNNLFARASIFASKWEYNLSMRLVAADDGSIRERAKAFRLSNAVPSSHPNNSAYRPLPSNVRAMKFTQIPLLSLACTSLAAIGRGWVSLSSIRRSIGLAECGLPGVHCTAWSDRLPQVRTQPAVRREVHSPQRDSVESVVVPPRAYLLDASARPARAPTTR